MLIVSEPTSKASMSICCDRDLSTAKSLGSNGDRCTKCSFLYSLMRVVEESHKKMDRALTMIEGLKHFTSLGLELWFKGFGKNKILSFDFVEELVDPMFSIGSLLESVLFI